MCVSPKDIEVGKCYVTPSGQVRRAKNRDQSDLRIERKESAPQRQDVGPKTTAAAEKFAAAIDKEVNCEHDPNYPQQKP
jgi:hypothetical protein